MSLDLVPPAFKKQAIKCPLCGIDKIIEAPSVGYSCTCNMSVWIEEKGWYIKLDFIAGVNEAALKEIPDHFRKVHEWLAKHIPNTLKYGDALDLSNIKIYCNNDKCKDFGGWIQRTADNLKKNIYTCDACGGKMERR